MRCLCGFELSGADEGELFAAVRTHCDQAHAQLGLSDGQLQDFVQAGLRARPWDGEPRPLPEEVEVRRLAPELAEDFLEFFDRDAFCDTPAMAACYCMAQYFAGAMPEWMCRRAAENRADMSQRLRTGRASGLLAYAEGRVCGWCNAGPKELYPGLLRTPELGLGPDEGVGSLVCFVVAPPYRRQGLAGVLLRHALDLLRDCGLRWAEAYPYKHDPPFGNYFLGTPALFREAGFDQEREAGKHVVLRKAL